MKNIHVPGAVWTTVLAMILYVVRDDIQVYFAGADWLPLAIAAIGYVLKVIQMRSEIQPQVLPQIPEDMYAPQATPLLEPTPPTKSEIAVKFLLG